MSIRIDIEAVSGFNVPGWSIGDELTLDALPDITRRLVAKALVHRPRTTDGTEASGPDSLAEAFRKGWEQGVEDFESNRPYYDGRDNPYGMPRNKKRGAA